MGQEYIIQDSPAFRLETRNRKIWETKQHKNLFFLNNKRSTERFTFQTASLFAVPTKYGWWAQNKTRVAALGAAGRATDDMTIKAFTETSTDGRNGTWVSNELSVSLQYIENYIPGTTSERIWEIIFRDGYLNVQANTLKPLWTLELFLLVYLNTIERKN